MPLFTRITLNPVNPAVRKVLRSPEAIHAVVSAAIEFKPEGRVCGTGAKMFTIAGPVIVYGTLAAVVYGGVLWLLGG